MKIKLVTTAATLALITIAVSNVLPPAPRAQAAPTVTAKAKARRQASETQFGDMTVAEGRFGELVLDRSKNGRRLVVNVSGTADAPCTIRTARYELTAPHLKAVLDKPTDRAPLRTTTATASGGTRVVVREAAVAPGTAPQTTVVTCERAVYTALNTAELAGRVELLGGDVRATLSGPDYPAPTTVRAVSGTIDILPGGQTRLRLLKGTFNGTYRERAPQPKNGGANR